MVFAILNKTLNVSVLLYFVERSQLLLSDLFCLDIGEGFLETLRLDEPIETGCNLHCSASSPITLVALRVYCQSETIRLQSLGLHIDEQNAHCIGYGRNFSVLHCMEFPLAAYDLCQHKDFCFTLSVGRHIIEQNAHCIGGVLVMWIQTYFITSLLENQSDFKVLWLIKFIRNNPFLNISSCSTRRCSRRTSEKSEQSQIYLGSIPGFFRNSTQMDDLKN